MDANPNLWRCLRCQIAVPVDEIQPLVNGCVLLPAGDTHRFIAITSPYTPGESDAKD